MKRTQVYIDHETYMRASTYARNTGTTISDLIRSSLKSHIASKKYKKMSRQKMVEWIEKLHLKYPASKRTPTDMASQHDHYLYGTPKKYPKATSVNNMIWKLIDDATQRAVFANN